MWKIFYSSIVITALCLVAAAVYGGLVAVTIAAFLAVLEITLSFDNAIVNSAILKDMEPKWQRRFMTWGMLIAVFGMRLVFPILLVAAAMHLSPVAVFDLALKYPDQYAAHVTSAHGVISAFGGTFLLMVFLGFILNHKRDLHWLGLLEQKIGMIGNLESIEVVVALLTLLGLQFIIPPDIQATILISGIIGICVYVIIHSLANYMNSYYRRSLLGTKYIRSAGVMSFIYLEVLDASFSFDSVVGAFALTKDLVIITLGLAIGAFFVRSLTLMLVQRLVLQNYVFLEHGAHYAIGALAIMMLLSIVYAIPGIYIGGSGAVIILIAFISSLLYKRKKII